MRPVLSWSSDLSAVLPEGQGPDTSLLGEPTLQHLRTACSNMLTVNHPVTVALATVVNGETVSFLNMHTALHQHNFVAGIILFTLLF